MKSLPTHNERLSPEDLELIQAWLYSSDRIAEHYYLDSEWVHYMMGKMLNEIIYLERRNKDVQIMFATIASQIQGDSGKKVKSTTPDDNDDDIWTLNKS